MEMVSRAVTFNDVRLRNFCLLCINDDYVVIHVDLLQVF